MPNFTPPNPYGSYFEFGQPEAAAMSAFLPSSTGNLSPHALTMMGRMPGGFNPTTLEYAMQRNREMANSQFMSHVLRSDARAAMLGDRALEAMIPDQATRSAFVKRMGGYGPINEVTSFLLNMPMVAGHIGGSHMSLGVGSMALATGNMSLNGYNYFGGNWAQNEIAKSIFNTINQRFYGPSGAANLGMTQGLNRDQIGGIMTLASAQGAFAGMDLGKLSVSGSSLSFASNQGTMNKIAEFTKSAAKALSGLIDIYGDRSVGELLDKAQSITGLNFSRFSNADTMFNRLQSLRVAANNFGYDPQTVMDMAAGTTGMLQRLGTKSTFAGAIAQQATLAALPTARQLQANAGVFYMTTPGLNEVASMYARDQMALSRDPLGARRAAVELMAQQGFSVADVRARLAGARPGDAGAIDQMVLSRTGISLSSYIRGMGGPDAVAGNLDEAGRNSLISANEADMQRRMRWNMQRLARKVLGPASARNEALLELTQDLSNKTVDALLGTEDDAGRRRILQEDLVGAGNSDRYLRLARQAGSGSLSYYLALRTAMNSNPLTARFESEADRQMGAVGVLVRLPAFDDQQRGQLRGGLVEGLLSRLGGQDPRSAFALLWQLNADELKKKGFISRIAGSGAGEEINLDRNQYFTGREFTDINAARRAAKMLNTMRDSIGRLEGGPAALERLLPGFSSVKDYMALTYTGADREALRAYTKQVLHPSNLVQAFSGFGMYKLGAATSFISARDFQTFKGHTPELAMLAAAASELHRVGAPEAAYATLMNTSHRVAGGKFTDSEQARLIEIGMGSLKSWETLQYFKPDALKKLTANAPLMRQELVDILSNLDAAIPAQHWWNYGDNQYSKKAKIREMIEALGGGPSQDVVTKIQGTLRVVDRNTMELVGDMTKQSNSKVR